MTCPAARWQHSFMQDNANKFSGQKLWSNKLPARQVCTNTHTHNDTGTHSTWKIKINALIEIKFIITIARATLLWCSLIKVFCAVPLVLLEPPGRGWGWIWCWRRWAKKFETRLDGKRQAAVVQSTDSWFLGSLLESWPRRCWVIFWKCVHCPLRPFSYLSADWNRRRWSHKLPDFRCTWQRPRRSLDCSYSCSPLPVHLK